ncbi:MAG TPA: hypothetical protein VKU19_14880 [Bryobacteraceae bacterium]|nr:hypothetical protein [Bryobacteraceae bacterium]
MTAPKPTVEQLLSDAHSEEIRRQRPKVTPMDAAERTFEAVGEGRYVLVAPAFGIELRVDRIRRDRHELTGELAVRCKLPGALTVVDGTLSVADFNLSSIRGRQDRAKFLASRARPRMWIGSG